MDKGFSLRGSFIISPNGKLRHITMNEPPVGRSVDEALRLVQAFKQVDAHGEVCRQEKSNNETNCSIGSHSIFSYYDY